MNESIPSIKPFENIDVDGSITLIAAAGFEERASAIFPTLKNCGMESQVNKSICIEYRPEKDRNDEEAIIHGLREIGLTEEINWIEFNRYAPDSFSDEFRSHVEKTEGSKFLVDISGMSKHLIMIIISMLSNMDCEIVIFYAEADTYGPTEEEFRTEWKAGPEETPAFLTYDIYDIVTSTELASVAKGGQPLILIAFPAFNYRKLMALASELSPRLLLSIEGVPHYEEDRWRFDAIRTLNEEVESYIKVKKYDASTFNYAETLEILDEIYHEYADTNRLVLAPTGSKLQTVAASIFRRLHSDIQIVYPVMTDFDEDYTKGWKATWGVKLGNIDENIEGCRNEEYLSLSDLKAKLNNRRDQ